MPEIKIDDDALKEGKIWIVNLLRLSGFAKTNGDARRLVLQGGVSIDSKKITDDKMEIKPENGMILQVGKRRFA